MADRNEQGRAINALYNVGPEYRQGLMDRCIFDARKELPKGTVFEVRTRIPGIYGEWGVAWYTSTKVPSEPLFQNSVDDPVPVEGEGYNIVARMVV